MRVKRVGKYRERMAIFMQPLIFPLLVYVKETFQQKFLITSKTKTVAAT